VIAMSARRLTETSSFVAWVWKRYDLPYRLRTCA
jgi:hypothetical protein